LFYYSPQERNYQDDAMEIEAPAVLFIIHCDATQTEEKKLEGVRDNERRGRNQLNQTSARKFLQGNGPSKG
jgi:hypothetical protein